MTDNGNKKCVPTTTEVSVNWEGLKRFIGWQGTIAELKKIELDRPEVLVLDNVRPADQRGQSGRPADLAPAGGYAADDVDAVKVNTRCPR
jgi:hypothetical protein